MGPGKSTVLLWKVTQPRAKEQHQWDLPGKMMMKGKKEEEEKKEEEKMMTKG